MHVHIVLFKDDVMDFTDSRCVFEYFLSVKVLGASVLMDMCEIARIGFEFGIEGSNDNTYNTILTLILSMTKDMCFDTIFVE